MNHDLLQVPLTSKFASKFFESSIFLSFLNNKKAPLTGKTSRWFTSIVEHWTLKFSSYPFTNN